MGIRLPEFLREVLVGAGTRSFSLLHRKLREKEVDFPEETRRLGSKNPRMVFRPVSRVIDRRNQGKVIEENLLREGSVPESTQGALWRYQKEEMNTEEKILGNAQDWVLCVIQGSKKG